MRRMIGSIALLIAVLGCSNDFGPDTHSRTVLIDLFHGAIDPTVASAIMEGGFSLQKGEGQLTKQTLQTVGVLWIADSASRDYQASEIKAVRAFVKAGGTAICSGQAWSWMQPGRDINRYPLNQLGAELGFSVTSQNIGKPAYNEVSPYLNGLTSVIHTDWWPSKIDAVAERFTPLIRDESMQTMAVLIPLGKGRVFVFGAAALLRDNPQIVLNILESR